MTPAKQPHPLRYRNKGTEEVFTDIGEMVLDAQKRYKILNDLVYCDIECVIQDPESPEEYFILDECGNWAYFPSKCYEVINDSSVNISDKVLDELEKIMREEEINSERTGYESYVWILHEVIPKLRQQKER